MQHSENVSIHAPSVSIIPRTTTQVSHYNSMDLGKVFLPLLPKLECGLDVPKMMSFRTSIVDGEASGKEGGIAGQKTQMLLHGDAQSQIDFVAEVAAKAAQRV